MAQKRKVPADEIAFHLGKNEDYIPSGLGGRLIVVVKAVRQNFSSLQLQC